MLFAFVFKRKEWKLDLLWLFKAGLIFSAGLSLIWLIYGVITGANVWDIFQFSLSQRAGIDRPYLPWLYLQINDFGMLTGWPLFLIGCTACWRALHDVITTRTTSPVGVLILAVFLTLAASDISGMSRGEVGRIWIYFAPFIVLAAASYLPEGGEERASQSIFATQAAILVVVVAFVHVIDSGFQLPLTKPPQLSQDFEVSYISADAVFDGTIRLHRYAGEVRGSNKLVIWIEWTSTGQVDTPYFISLIPVSPDGSASPTATLIQPFQDKYPTTCWHPSSGVILERIEIPIDSTSQTGDWWVSLSLVNGENGYQPDVTLSNGHKDKQIGIGPFR
jgi:hypothetical protein